MIQIVNSVMIKIIQNVYFANQGIISLLEHVHLQIPVVMIQIVNYVLVNIKVIAHFANLGII